jgi:DNA primase
MNLFSFVKSQIPVQQVICEYVTLVPAGSYLKGKCPFHGERTGSFTVSPHKEIFYCFGCHASGDVIGFIAKIENCSQLEAAKILVERYNLSVPETLQSEFKQASKESLDEKKRYFSLCKQVALWCQRELKKSPTALNYVTGRNITAPIIDMFAIGYFPGSSKNIKELLNAIKQEGFLAEDLLQAGILLEGKESLYSPFEDRIIFPLKDHLGQFCGFGGRIYKPNDDRVKYYNSRENPYFNKGALLYGLDIAKKEIQTTNTAILVEGYTDCIMINQHGHKNVIASMGTACTTEHLHTLARYADTIYVLYDGDQAGQNAMFRLTELCWNVNLELKVVRLPEQEDPASFVENGGNIALLLRNACSIVTFFIERSGKAFASKTLKQKLETTDEIVQLIGNIRDPLKRKLVIQEAATCLNVPVQTLEQTFKTVRNKLTQEPAALSVQTQQPVMEEKLFATLLMKAETVEIAQFDYAVQLLSQPFRDILERLQNYQKNNSLLGINNFLETLTQEHKALVSKYLLQFDQSELQGNFDYTINEFNKKHWQHIVETIKNRIVQAQAARDTAEVSRLLVQLQEMKKNMMTKMYQRENRL